MNANELTICHGILEVIATNIGREYPLWKAHCVMAAFSDEKTVQRTRPTPDESRFIVGSEVSALATKPENMAMCEKAIRENRQTYEPILETTVAAGAKKFLQKFGIQVVRMSLAKSADTKLFPYGSKNEKLTEKRLHALEIELPNLECF